VSTRVLIFDDENLVQSSLGEFQDIEPGVVNMVRDIEKIVQELEQNQYDLIALDLRVPGLKSDDLFRVANLIPNDTRFVLLTEKGSLLSAVQDLQARNRNIEVKTVQTEQKTGPVCLGKGSEVVVDWETRIIRSGAMQVSITPLEVKLLQFFIANPGKLLTHQRIVQQVHGFEAKEWEAPRLLRPMISRLRSKLARFPEGDQWIINVRGTGYIYTGNSEQ
jgi:DNA-binding response OmpR family regulator